LKLFSFELKEKIVFSYPTNSKASATWIADLEVKFFFPSQTYFKNTAEENFALRAKSRHVNANDSYVQRKNLQYNDDNLCTL
jgi:hypothetical protein